MKCIELTNGHIALVDDVHYDGLIKHKWYARKGSKTFYALRNSRDPVSGKRSTILMHREIAMCDDRKLQIDHINGDGLDNRLFNLRLSTASQNQMNRGCAKHCMTGIKGVHWYKNSSKWRAYIRVNKKAIHLGYFESLVDAKNARERASIKFHGEFAQISV